MTFSKNYVFILQLLIFVIFYNSVQEAQCSPLQRSELPENHPESETPENLPREIRKNEVVHRQDEEDDDEPAPSRPVNAFPGIANIILGTLTGDVRRIIEDGAFSFVNKDVRNQVFLIYHGLLGRVTTPASVTTTKKPRRRTTTEDPEKEIEEKEISTKKTTSVSASSNSNGNNNKLSASPSQQPSAQSQSGHATTPRVVQAVTVGPDDEDELVSRFEQALLPYLPANPQDAVITEMPIIM